MSQVFLAKHGSTKDGSTANLTTHKGVVYIQIQTDTVAGRGRLVVIAQGAHLECMAFKKQFTIRTERDCMKGIADQYRNVIEGKPVAGVLGTVNGIFCQRVPLVVTIRLDKDNFRKTWGQDPAMLELQKFFLGTSHEDHSYDEVLKARIEEKSSARR